MWTCDPFMNGNGLNTIGLNVDVILVLFWTKAMALMGLSMDSMMDLDLDCIYGLDLYLGPLMDLKGPCLCKASIDRHRPLLVSSSRH